MSSLVVDLKKDPRVKIYSDLLRKWNQAYNLTSIVDPNEILVKHFEDSLRLVSYLPKTGKVLDVGTGAGFPGIPLKMALPGLDVTLLDSKRKKILFCETVIRELKMDGIRAIQGRIEGLDCSSYDVIVSRATFKAEEFFKILAPFLGKNKKMLLMKGPSWEEEMKHLSLKVDVFPYTLSDGSQRVLLQLGASETISAKS